MTWITKAEYRGEHALFLTFNDGFTASIDLYETLAHDHRKILNALANVDEFRKCKVENDTVVWENGADLSPEFLRALAEEQSLIHV